MDEGLPVVPGAGAQGWSSAASSPAPPEPPTPSTGPLATGAPSPLPSPHAKTRLQQANLKLTKGRGEPARDDALTPASMASVLVRGKRAQSRSTSIVRFTPPNAH